MARINVNPTRMELTRLKKRLKVARRGHKLLKDKRDELMKKFLNLIKENKELRLETEEKLTNVNKNFSSAKAVMSSHVLEEALMLPGKAAYVNVGQVNIMSVKVPSFSWEGQEGKGVESLPYGFASTSGQLDTAVELLLDTMPLITMLAETEKAAQLLALEIERTRRRVNALEHIMIPQLEETIKYISMKLDENERANTSRLMKVKDMMIEKLRKEKIAMENTDGK